MKKIYKLLLMSFFIFSGCQKYLDIKPKGRVIPATVEDFERILNADFHVLRPLDVLLDQLSDDYYDPTVIHTSKNINANNQTYFWGPNIAVSISDARYGFYNTLYGNIYQYNAVINGIDAATGGTPVRKSVVKARAKALRAMSYWYLVNLFAKPYLPASASTDLGVSLVTDADLNTKLPDRGTVQKTYDFILKDMNDAMPDLPVSNPNNYLLSKAGGYGILARVYLTMGNFSKAGEAAGQMLTLKNNLLNYSTEYSTFDADSFNFLYIKESSLLEKAAALPENIFLQYYNYTGGMSGLNIAMPTEKMFPDDDLRRMFFTPSNFEDYYYYGETNKWDGVYKYNDYVSLSYNIGIATPEMYLIRAEANARAGKIQDAMKDINTLRKNRIKTEDYKELNASNTIDAVKIVLAERRKELLFKGTRWFDMRRLNNDPNYGFTAKRYFADGSSIDLEPNSIRYVLRLPESAVTGGIKQNP